MKKRVLLLSLFTSIFLFNTIAQSLVFVHDGKVLDNNAEVTITDFSNDPDIGIEMLFDATIRNTTNKAVKLTVKKSEIETAEASTNNFCTASGCYGTLESAAYTIVANGEDKMFHGAFYPTKASTATVKYTASVVGAFGDAVSVTVRYQYAPSGVESVGFERLTVSQANGLVALNYRNNQAISLRIVGLLGETHAQYTIPANSNYFETPQRLKKGLYLLVFKNNNNQIFTKKIIIN